MYLDIRRFSTVATVFRLGPRMKNFFLEQILIPVLPLKRLSYIEAYFGTIHQIARHGPTRRFRFWFAYSLVKLVNFGFMLQPSENYEQLDELYSVLILDYFYILKLPRTYISLSVNICYQLFYYYYLMHFRAYSNGICQLPYQVLIRRNERIFLERTFTWPIWGHQEHVCLALNRFTLLIFNAGQVFIGIADCLLLFVQLQVLPVLWRNLAFFIESGGLGVALLLQLEINVLLSNLFIIECLNSGILMITCLLLCSLIIFLQVHQSHRLLAVCWRQLRRLHFRKQLRSFQSVSLRAHTTLQVMRFAAYHNKCFLEIQNVNAFVGTFILHFVLLNTPVNAYLVMSLIYGLMPSSNVYFIFAVIAVQLMGLFAIHLFGILFSRHIHQCSGQLIRLYVTCGQAAQSETAKGHYFGLALSIQLKLHCYIQKFHTLNRYGITYGPYGLVSFNSFSRLIFFYMKFLIFFYQLNKYL